MIRALFRPLVWFLLGALLFVIGAKLCLIRSFGSDVPYADQWAGEGSSLFQVKMRFGGVPLKHFFFPHGEHRPATMRLWAYALFRANGNQWDARVECVANLLFQALTCVTLWWLAAQFLSGGWLAAARVLTAVLCALPCNFENFVWGFQSQFLLLILGGLFHVAGTMTATRPGFRWTAAQLAGFVAILSLSSGMMSAVALSLIAVLELVRGRRDAWAWSTLAANVALAAFGFWFLNPVVAASDHVHSAWQFLRDMSDLLAWPAAGKWGLLGALPLAIAVIPAIRRGDEGRQPRLLLALALWLLGLMAALTIGRGGGANGMFIATRYQDILVLGCWTTILAVLWRWERSRGFLGCAGAVLLALCLIPMAAGLWRLNAPERIRDYARIQTAYIAKHDDTVREFMRTNDPAVFERDPVIRSAFPHLGFTMDILRDPAMRPALAPSLQPDGRADWLSRMALIIVNAAPWIVGIALALLALTAGHSLHRYRSAKDVA
jgi:hypothetical protein